MKSASAVASSTISSSVGGAPSSLQTINQNNQMQNNT
jgi:hypothetical protein